MSIFQKFRDGLLKTSKSIREKIQDIFQPGRVTQEFLDDLEAVLIQADVGVKAAQELRESLEKEVKGRDIKEPAELYDVLADKVAAIFEEIQEPLRVAESGPTVYVFVGVNGSGKTTTIGKVAGRWVQAGKKVIVAAADTFRAAADDQLKVWADRVGASIVRHQEGSDPGAVAFDAIQSAIARKVDVVLVDTAGRLQTKKNLMEELKKVVRVISKALPGAPHEVILVIDGTTGQNGLSQARVFKEAVGVTGVCLTKMDGSAKGGVALAIAREMGIPVKLIGFGEGLEDLKDFDARAFAAGLFGRDS